MRIRMAENFRAVFYAPFYAAHALGFYAREGVEVELLTSSAPGGGPGALADGSADITWGGPLRVMKAHDEDPASPLVCFCEVVGRDPFFLLGRGDGSAFRLADLARLRFASVAEVPTPWLCLQHDLREHGVDPAKLARTTGRTMGENLAALRRGDVDVIQVFEPYASLALRDGARILYAASSRGPTVYTTFLATRAGIERHRAAFAAMTRAVARMQGWLAAQGGDALAEATAPFYPDLPGEVLTRALGRYHQAGLWSRSTEVARAGFARLAESLLTGGFISRRPAYEDCVDRRLE
ncbi:MAG TPA: ABC transporter substrate-binding protein [Xanthobacteraceae bacterium]|nr:ABC transporter substrate-binding protein [Xanthobacteraceae bacterium]